MIRGSADEYYIKFYKASSKSKHEKVRKDFASSIHHMPGSELGKRKLEPTEREKPCRKKMNDKLQALTYQIYDKPKVRNAYNIASHASLSTMHSNIEGLKPKPQKESYHRYQTKRGHKLKYKN
jgi:hypothetical protein